MLLLTYLNAMKASSVRNQKRRQPRKSPTDARSRIVKMATRKRVDPAARLGLSSSDMRNLPLRLAVPMPFAALVSLLAVSPVANNDIWLHLKTGSLILERGHVPQVDSYTFTRAGAPYIAHEWLAQVLFAILYRLGGGMGALSLFYAALIGALLWLIYRETARRIVEDGAERRIWAPPIATLTTVAAFIQMTAFLAIRPHILSFLL